MRECGGPISVCFVMWPPIAKEQTELKDGVKYTISLESLHSHKWSKSNASRILLTLIWHQISIEL